MTEPKAGLKGGYYLLNTDGGSASTLGRRAGDPLPVAAIGVLLRTRRLARVDERAKAIGHVTHNVAEYHGLIEGLKLAREHGVEHIRVYMDSELVVDQVNGDCAVKEPHLRELHDDVTALRAQFKSVRISWVPREMNAEADRLVRDTLSALD
jgi:probable phosphoglycerate mutase